MLMVSGFDSLSVEDLFVKDNFLIFLGVKNHYTCHTIIEIASLATVSNCASALLKVFPTISTYLFKKKLYYYSSKFYQTV